MTSDPPLASSFRSFSRGAGVVAAGLGVLGLTGWIVDAAMLKSVVPGLAPIKANTALGLVLAGTALALLAASEPRARRFVWVCALAVTLLGALTLVEYVLGRGLGIDELLFEDLLGRQLGAGPGRMAPHTAVSFILVGLALLSSEAGARSARMVPGLALGVVAVAALPLLAFGYGAQSIHSIGRYTQMAFPTALAFLLLGLGMLSAHPDRGLMAVLASPDPGAAMVRRLLFVAVAAPPLLGWLRLLGERAGLYGLEFGLAFMAVATAAVAVLVVLLTARGTELAHAGRASAEQALRQQAEHLKHALDSTAEGVIVADENGRFLLWNPAAERIIGLGATETDVKEWSETYGLFLPDGVTRCPAEDVPLARALRGEECTDVDLFVRHPGQPGGIYISATAQPVADETGARRGGVVVFRDVTEKKKAEQVLARNLAELERSNQDLQEFAAAASHDLQEPLRKIVGFGDLLAAEHGQTLGEEGRDYVRRMTNAAHRMEELIEGLLELSRVTTRGGPLEPTPLDGVVSGVLSDLEDRLRRSGGRVEVGPLPAVTADARQMRRLFLNLIGNALKFHRSDEPPLVRVHARAGRDGSWEITVADDGIGFEEKHADRIFQPFQRLHARSEYEGTGMGLAICRKIVSRHGGAIVAMSRAGEGSAFVVTLPGGSPEQGGSA